MGSKPWVTEDDLKIFKLREFLWEKVLKRGCFHIASLTYDLANETYVCKKCKEDVGRIWFVEVKSFDPHEDLNIAADVLLHSFLFTPNHPANENAGEKKERSYKNG